MSGLELAQPHRPDQGQAARVSLLKLEQRRKRRRAEENKDAAWKPLERGWCLGDKAFRRELQDQMKERHGPNNSGEERFESDETKALRIVGEELERRGWAEEELRRLRKGDKDKVRIATRLRRETIMTLKWIAGRLAMGSWTDVSNLLAAARK